jgi:hypothetical protein
MDFRRLKLRLALQIINLGMLAALLWHAGQGWGWRRGYPYNTFLGKYQPFSDFTDPVQATVYPSPYHDHFAVYFPFTYVLAKAFLPLGPLPGAFLYLGVTSLGLCLVLLMALRPMIPHRGERLVVSLGLLLPSYPFLYGLDRANLELGLALLVAISLLYFRGLQWVAGLIWLLLAIALKCYPALLLALFVRPKHWRKVVMVGMAFITISLSSLMSFPGTLAQNALLWRSNFQFFTWHYVIGNLGLGGSASPWNTCKAVLVSLGLFYDVGFPDPSALYFFYNLYQPILFAVIATATLHAIFVEHEFFRRAILLLILMTVAAPSSGDYKLLFDEVALVILILLPGQRARDLMVTGLLAFVLIPKREILLLFLGPTDTTVPDVSIGILLNPPCLLLAVCLLISDGAKASSRTFARQRILGLIGSFRSVKG